MSPQFDVKGKKFYDDIDDELNRNNLSCQNSKSASGTVFDQTRQAYSGVQFKKGNKLGEIGQMGRRQSASNSEFFNLNLQIKNPEPNTRQNISIQIQNVHMDNKESYYDPEQIIENAERKREQERTQEFISQRMPSPS